VGSGRTAFVIDLWLISSGGRPGECGSAVLWAALGSGSICTAPSVFSRSCPGWRLRQVEPSSVSKISWPPFWKSGRIRTPSKSAQRGRTRNRARTNRKQHRTKRLRLHDVSCPAPLPYRVQTPRHGGAVRHRPGVYGSPDCGRPKLCVYRSRERANCSRQPGGRTQVRTALCDRKPSHSHREYSGNGEQNCGGARGLICSPASRGRNCRVVAAAEESGKRLSGARKTGKRALRQSF